MSDVTLHLGDCLEYMRTLPDGAVDAVVTDPPYNSGVKYGTYKDVLLKDEYWQWLGNVIAEAKRIADNVYIKHSAGKIHDWAMNIGNARMLVWYKPFSSGFPINGFATHFEPIWCVKGGAICWSKDVFVQSSGNSNPEASSGHPAQMPESLANWLITTATNPGATVFDPFMGSGTTGVACVRTGRKFIGCEIDPAYFAIAQRRIAEAQLQPPLFPHEPAAQAEQLTLEV